MKLYALNMEGDFGQEDLVFPSREAAKEWASKSYTEQMGDSPDDPFEEYWADFCGTREVRLVGEPECCDTLRRLQDAGVDNWEGYSYAFSEEFDKEATE